MTPLPRTRILCLDEMGPIAVKIYPGEEWKLGPYSWRKIPQVQTPLLGDFGIHVPPDLLSRI